MANIARLRKKGLRGLAATALYAALLGAAGCSTESFNDAFGLSKQAPDESKVRVTQPLAMPPDYTLHAPDTSRPAAEPGKPVPPLSAQRRRAGAQPPVYGQGTPATINPQYPQYPQQQPYPQPPVQQQAQRQPVQQPYPQQQRRYPSQPVYQPGPLYPQYPSQPVYQPRQPQPYPVQQQAANPQYPAQGRQPRNPQYPAQGGQPGAGQPRPVNAPTRVASAGPQAGAAQAGAAPAPDVYQMYGISKVNPDGTPKSKDQLRDELRKAYIKKRKNQNPKYGTVWNFWNAIFGE